MQQLEHFEAIEKRLWSAADDLRANSNYASNEYFLPVMGLVFLRHAHSRYCAVRDDIIANGKLPQRSGKTRPLKKEDFSSRSAIFLKDEAQFDHLVSLPDGSDRAQAIISAMESIEADYENLRGTLPKNEYNQLSNEVLGTLLRVLNPEELKQVKGDVFGRIYEYFLTKFADQGAHDGGEFFTPISLVSLIAHVLDPKRGVVLDPACGSGGMFVQSARTVEEQGANPATQLTFRGLEKNELTIRLAKMNLAVHGLEGDIKQAITYYEDPHDLIGKADYVMANPPFNVDAIDADKVKTDPRLPFGTPSINKAGKVGNGNYVWISYFYSYLNKSGRAGFVMSSQASSASGEEAKVRQNLIETGAVDAMIAIRSNFFYTRSVPCELWFINKTKPKQHRDKVLMIDARNIYREVTRKICDFSPEQQNNLLAIVWLHRGESKRFLSLVKDYLNRVITASNASSEPLQNYAAAIAALIKLIQPFPKAAALTQCIATQKALGDKTRQFQKDTAKMQRAATPQDSKALNKQTQQFATLANASDDLIKEAGTLYKQAMDLLLITEKELKAIQGDKETRRAMNEAKKHAEHCHEQLTAYEKSQPVMEWGVLKRVAYFWQQAHWLMSRFPDAKLCDVEGLVKLVSHTEISENDWSLTPGRYVGVAAEEEDSNFDFAESMQVIHTELETLNAESVTLAATIKKNLKGVGA